MNASQVTEVDILSEVIAPDEAGLPAEFARYVVNLDFPPRAVERMHDLAEKNRSDALTEAERAELERYIRVGHFLSLMKSKARRSLDSVDPVP